MIEVGQRFAGLTLERRGEFFAPRVVVDFVPPIELGVALRLNRYQRRWAPRECGQPRVNGVTVAAYDRPIRERHIDLVWGVISHPRGAKEQLWSELAALDFGARRVSQRPDAVATQAPLTERARLEKFAGHALYGVAPDLFDCTDLGHTACLRRQTYRHASHLFHDRHATATNWIVPLGRVKPQLGA